MNTLLRKTLVLAIALWSSFLSAEDIDLFVSVPPADPNDRPNVLLIIDNTGNWNTAFENEKAALKAVFSGLPVDKFNVGLMFYGSPDSGYVRAAIRTINEENRVIYSNLINGLDQGDDRQSARTLGRTMSEAHRYLTGKTSVGGSAFAKRDFKGNVSGNPASNAVYALPGNALSSSSATVYNSPLLPESCAKTFVIYIGNTTSGGNVTKDNSARNSSARTELIEAGGDAGEISLSPSAFQDNVADEWSRFFKEKMGIITYTVDVDPGTNAKNNGPANSALLKSMANVGGGKYFAVNSQVGGGSEIAAALNQIFSEIQSVNSVFASVSLPVSVNTQGTYLNQVYVGVFRPESFPRWYGNIKQYKMGYANLGSGQFDNRLRLLDAEDRRAISVAGTGFIDVCARSFWTPDESLSSTSLYWAGITEENCPPYPAASDTPDGNLVEKGGHSVLLRKMPPASRKVLTCNASCAPTLVNFTSANVTSAKLGVSAAAADSLINWVRGQNVASDPISGRTGATLSSSMRPSSHGDVVHSKPVAINYAATEAESPKVVVYYGGNDGMLRAINGSRDGGETISGKAPGEELWSFVAPESYLMLNRLKDNSPPIKYEGITVPPSLTQPKPKDYGFDGGLTAYQGGGKVWLYGTMRRGGNSIYAFDVTDPATPKLMWRITPNTAQFSQIGQTWSAPTVVKTAAAPDKPLLLVGGGYDTCEDKDPADCDGVTKGSQIYLIDAESGEHKQTFATNGRVIGDVTAVRYPTGTANAGLLKYAYAADLNGDVYRISGAFDSVKGFLPIDSTSPGTWVITQIASLGGTGVAQRKFMFAPDVVQQGGSISLLLGSGDREKPVTHYANATAVQNYFYRINDVPSDICWPNFKVSGACPATVVPGKPDMIVQDSLVTTDPGVFSKTKEGLDEGDRVVLEQTSAALAGARGWKLPLVAPGEKTVTSALTIFGKIYFSTHQPAFPKPGQCGSNLGIAKTYPVGFDLPFFDADEIPGGGLPPSPVAGLVTLDDGKTVPFCIGCDASSPLEGGEPPPPEIANQPKARVFWNIENLE